MSKLTKRLYIIESVGELKCIIEPNMLMWYERVFVNKSKRGLGYCKWLFRESILDFKGNIEVDVLKGKPELKTVFKDLQFQPNGPSKRFLDCRLWHLNNNYSNRRKIMRIYNPISIPIYTETLTWESRYYLWEENYYTVDNI